MDGESYWIETNYLYVTTIFLKDQLGVFFVSCLVFVVLKFFEGLSRTVAYLSTFEIGWEEVQPIKRHTRILK